MGRWDDGTLGRFEKKVKKANFTNNTLYDKGEIREIRFLLGMRNVIGGYGVL